MNYVFTNLMEVRVSSIHGRGVFAKDFIPKDTVIEEAPYIEVAPNATLRDYIFRINDSPLRALVFGFGSLYNTALTKKESHITYSCDSERKCFIFKTIKDIQPDEEILTFYGTDWINKRSNFQSTIEPETDLEKLHLLKY